MSYITSIGTAVPEYKYSQESILNYMKEYMGKGDERVNRLLGSIFKNSHISNRYSTLPDFNSESDNSGNFFDADKKPDVGKRMQKFKQGALPLAGEAVNNCLAEGEISEVTHLITVTCTGLSAPGLDLDLIKFIGFEETVFRQSVNFIGCYAAFPALRQADDICRSHPEAKVLIVDVELCTLHFQDKASQDNMLANSLFSDGAAAVLVSNRPGKNKRALRIDDFYSTIIPDENKNMAWEVHSEGFLMNLSSYIPDLLKSDLKNVLEGAFINKNTSELQYAVHPGGSRILSAFTQSLGIDEDSLSFSRQILKDYGNMSSATILFVLKKFLESDSTTDSSIFATGFGPGITVESMFLTPVNKVKPSTKQRSSQQELLDAPVIPEKDLVLNLKELHVINTLLGGYEVIKKGLNTMLKRHPQPNISILDIGSGGGDTLGYISKKFKKKADLKLTGVDLKPECIRYSASKYKKEGIEFLESDYRKLLENTGQRHDVVTASLFCHHLSDNDLVDLLKWMHGYSRKGFIINDIHRHSLAYYSIKWLTTLFSGSYLVKNDAPLSVLRAFKRNDWEKYMMLAGIKNYEIRWVWAFRWLVMVDKQYSKN